MNNRRNIKCERNFILVFCLFLRAHNFIHFLLIFNILTVDFEWIMNVEKENLLTVRWKSSVSR
jgi:hypothetical protein